MALSNGVNSGCLLVGDFIEENQLPTTAVAASVGQAQETVFLGTFVDYWPGDAGNYQFKVLLQDSRVVTVRGDGLRYIQNPSNPADQGSYGIVVQTGEAERLVALFRVSEVTGIFSGGFELQRASA